MPELKRKLTLPGLTMIAIGSCIGAGIFIAPAQIAQAVPHAGLILTVWALGGIIALTGALTFSELGGMFPASGGVYAYLREAYGPVAGFLYGWTILLVINTGALAGLCVAFAEYLKIFWPDMEPSAKTGIAAATMLLLTAVNLPGVQHSQRLASLFTSLKLAAVVAIIAAGFFAYDPVAAPIHLFAPVEIQQALPAALLTGLIGVLFSIGGWHHASYVAGEAQDAQRTVPKAMFRGVVVVLVMYLAVNLAYLFLLPIDTIATTPRVAATAIATLASWGGKAVAVAIALSIFGTISIYSMSAPRIYYAMAADGVFFRQLAFIHPTWRTPVVAMLVQVAWALLVLLFFRGLFDRIITFVTFMDITFMGLAGAAVFRFRITRPEAHRPVRVWGYPWVPLLFVMSSLAFAINTLLERPGQAVPGLALLALGGAVYFFLRRRQGAPDRHR
ncbi:MAG: hypothetical protein RLY31_760 [Bacteroidota bacterium]|jgi:APA family basic amino acid/polyamine antiporter